MQTRARSWILRSFGPQARFWHSFDISFSKSCFPIQSSSPQPNGARVQNCAGIFEDVNIWMWNWSARNKFPFVRMVWVTTGTTMEAVFRKASAVFAISKSLPEPLWGDSVLTGGSSNKEENAGLDFRLWAPISGLWMNSSRLFGRRSSACPSTKGSLGQVRSGHSSFG